MTTDKVLIQVGEEVIELQGAEKQAFLARVAQDVEKEALIEKEKQNKIIAKAALLERLGISDEEAALLIA